MCPPAAPLAWPCLAHGDSLKLVAAAGMARARSLARFFGASFCGLGLLLLLAGAQHAVPPALAGGGACLFCGLLLLLLPGLAQPPVLLLNRESRMAALCRRRFGRRRFRLFPFAAVEIVARGNGTSAQLAILPRGSAAASSASGPDMPDIPGLDTSGLDVPGLPSHISARQWREGMLLPCPDNDPERLRDTLLAWMAGKGEIAGDDAEARNAVVPAPVLHALEGTSGWRPGGSAGEVPAGRRAARPPIRRAGDLRDSTRGRDKRD